MSLVLSREVEKQLSIRMRDKVLELDEDLQEKFQEDFEEDFKKKETMLLFAIFLPPVQLFLLGKIALGVWYLILWGGLGIWWIIEIVNVKKRVSTYNSKLANEVYDRLLRSSNKKTSK